MKKVFAIIISFVLLLSVALADIDLTSMSYNDLIKLRNQLNAEIMSRPEWKEVNVPAGQWVVGVDIPAGDYCLSTTKKSVLVQVWRKAVDDFSNDGLAINTMVKSDNPMGKVTLEKGWVFTCTDIIVFSPPVSLGF